MNQNKIYELECYLDNDGTFGINFTKLRECWFSGLRTQNGIYGAIKHVKGKLVGFMRRISKDLNALLGKMETQNEDEFFEEDSDQEV